MDKRAIVVGAGVIGLTAAVSLLEDGWKVHIISDQFSPNTTSDGPAAFWEPYFSFPEEKVSVWAKDAFHKFVALMKEHPEIGIKFFEGFKYENEPMTESFWELLEHEHLPKSQIPKGFLYGMKYKTMIIPPSRFMPWLMRRIDKLGGTKEIKKLNQIEELSNHPFRPSIIVNCTGLGSFELFNDKESHPIRGQVVKVWAPWVTQFASSFKGDELTHIFPREDGVILGGVVQKGNWSTEIDPQVRTQILKRCDELMPGLANSEILAEWSGLRPGRTQIRLEIENRKLNPSRTMKVIHNYGHGGGGVTLSWGCAKEVVSLANQVLREETTPRSKL